jgi:hypothetical protein
VEHSSVTLDIALVTPATSGVCARSVRYAGLLIGRISYTDFPACGKQKASRPDGAVVTASSAFYSEYFVEETIYSAMLMCHYYH